MTQEEKAKAYDEAIERAKKQRADYQKELDKTDKSSQLAGILRAGISAIELAFPELAESKDERIRKVLVNEISGWSDVYKMFKYAPKEKVLAWLEKHKESLHIHETCKENANSFTDEDERVRGAIVELVKRTPSSMFDADIEFDWVGASHDEILAWLEKQKEPHYTKRNALFDKCVANCDPEIMKKVSDEVDEKLKEQNPAEYLDLDNASQDYVYDHFCQGADFTPDYIKGLMEDAFIDGANWQKEQEHPCDSAQFEEGFKTGYELGLRKKEEQKSAEWSKEDNIGWDEAFACVTLAEKAAKNEEELQNAVTAEKWLKEIKFKYYVHPVKQEWSAEETKDLVHILKVLDDCYAYGKHDLSKTDHDNLTSMLKSLRPLKDCSSCAKHLEGYISGRSDAENKLLEQFGALITPEDELRIKPRWKPSEDEERLINTSISFLKDFADKGYENAVECIDWLKSKLNGDTCK